MQVIQGNKGGLIKAWIDGVTRASDQTASRETAAAAARRSADKTLGDERVFISGERS